MTRFDKHIMGFRIRTAFRNVRCQTCSSTIAKGMLRFDFIIDIVPSVRNTECVPCAAKHLRSAANKLQQAVDDPNAFKLLEEL